MKTRNSSLTVTAIVLLLMLGTMVVTPSQYLRAQEELVKVFGYVFDDRNGNGVWDTGLELEEGLNGIQVDLHDISSLDPVSVETSPGGYFEFEISQPSYYEVRIETPGEVPGLEGRVYFGNETPIVRVHDESLDLGYIGLRSRDINATIRGAVTDGGTGQPVNGATVTLRERANDYEILTTTSPIREYENKKDKWMISRNITLPPSETAYLRFKHWYLMEDGIDGGNVQISIDWGSSWEVLYPIGNYTDFTVVYGQGGFTGDSNGWKSPTFALGDYAGRTVRIAFRFASDSNIVYEGWFIDDIKIETASQDLFFDDVENGNFQRWDFKPQSDPWQISDSRYYLASPTHSWYCGLDIEGWYSMDIYDGEFEIEVSHMDYSPTFQNVVVMPNNIIGILKNTDIISSSEELYLNDDPMDPSVYQMDYLNGTFQLNLTVEDTDVIYANYNYTTFEDENLTLGALGDETIAQLNHTNITLISLYRDGSPWPQDTEWFVDMLNGTVTYNVTISEGTLIWADYTYNGSIDVLGEVLTNTSKLSYPAVPSTEVIEINGNPANYILDALTGRIHFTQTLYNTDTITASYTALHSVENETVQLVGGTRADLELYEFVIRGKAHDAEKLWGITDGPIHVALFDLGNNRFVTKTDDDPPEFRVGAYPGNFSLVVRIDGYKTVTLPSVTVTNASIDVGKQYFERSEEERIENKITFKNGDWNFITVNRSWQLNSESYLEGMEYSELHNLRLQVDVTLGNGDGTLNTTEIDMLVDWLEAKGPRHVITDEFFLIDDNHFISNHSSYSVTVAPDINSSINSTDVIWINTSTEYNTTGIESGQDEYNMTQYVEYDTSIIDQTEKNFTYRIELPTQDGIRYEMVENETLSGIDVRGFLAIRIDPPQGSGGPVAVDMTIRRSENGTAKIEITDPLDRVHFLDTDFDNYSAVVPANLNITFSAATSTDPNSPTGLVSPNANFTWLFDKFNASDSTRYGMEPDFNYTQGGKYTVNLTISESGLDIGGNMSYREATIFVDELDPEAQISVNITALGEYHENANNMTIEVNETVMIRFDSEKSTDSRFESSEGNIVDWKWDLESDGTWDEFVPDFTHSFYFPGNHTVNLTVADEVGHWSSNVSVFFVIKDITPPGARVIILNDTFMPTTFVVENKTFYFNASESGDNYDDIDNLTFEWDFGDGTVIQAQVGNYNVSHNYTRIDTYNLTVNVTDRAGNTGNSTLTVQVRWDSASRPDLEIAPGTFYSDPETVEEGQRIKLSVNISNKVNHATARNVEVHFYLKEGDKETEIGAGSLKFYNESGLIPGQVEIAAEEEVRAEITWTPEVVGKLTILIKVSDAEEHSEQIGSENRMTDFVTVSQAPWKTWLVYIVLIVIIILVIVVVWLRRKWQRGELRFRRRKKEEPKEKKKKKK
ncbi:MAG: PKD domain-containing protein [Thermoplasmata archaeon]